MGRDGRPCVFNASHYIYYVFIVLELCWRWELRESKKHNKILFFIYQISSLQLVPFTGFGFRGA